MILTLPDSSADRCYSKDIKRKLPIGIHDFVLIRQDDYLYVDKTELVYNLVNNGRAYFLSRPRRFGKSLLLDLLRLRIGGLVKASNLA
jgi:hypothetical protein